MLVAHLDPLAVVDLQPDGDRQPAARLRDARLALAQQLSLRLRRRILGHRRACPPPSAFTAAIPELYLIAILTALFRGLLLPYLVWRIIGRLNVAREIHEILQPSSTLVAGALGVVFALVVSYRIGQSLGLAGTVAVLALTVMLSMKLIGFLMLAVRHEAFSQILGLLVLENGIFLGAQILVPGMPMLIEIVILFDLLVVVACFGVLVRYLVAHVGSTSSLDLNRLVG